MYVNGDCLAFVNRARVCGEMIAWEVFVAFE